MTEKPENIIRLSVDDKTATLGPMTLDLDGLTKLVSALEPLKDILELGDSQSAVADTRPANCRNRLQDEGKPYPKSGCEAMPNCRFGHCPFERENKGPSDD